MTPAERAALVELVAGHEVEVALAVTQALGGNPHDAGLRLILQGLPALLADSERVDRMQAAGEALAAFAEAVLAVNLPTVSSMRDALAAWRKACER